MLARFAVAAALVTGLLPVHAQDNRRSATNVYHVQYVFRDGADANNLVERRYTMLVNGGHKGVFKVGTKTPTVTGAFQPLNVNPLVNTQYTYLDVGVTIECQVQELDTRVELHSTLDLSTLAENEPPPPPNSVRNPNIKQTRMELNSTLTLGRPTVIATIADAATRRNLQVEATVTPVN
jgi:hypothetical protein